MNCIYNQGIESDPVFESPTAFPISFKWASHIAVISVLMGRYTTQSDIQNYALGVITDTYSDILMLSVGNAGSIWYRFDCPS